MATGVGMGFDLDALDKAIKNAEKSFDNLIKKGQETEKTIVNNFKNMATQGVDVFVNKLNEANTLLARLGEGKGGKKTAISKSVDDANTLLAVVNKINSQGILSEKSIQMRGTERFVELMNTINTAGKDRTGGRIKQLNEEIDEAKKKLGELQNLLNFYTKGEGKTSYAFADTSATQREAKALMARIEMLEREKEHVQANAALRSRVNDQRIAQQNEINRQYQSSLDKQSQASNNAAKAENRIYEERDKKHEERQRAYNAMGRKMNQQTMQDLAAEYEAEQRYNKQRQSNQQSQMESMRKFAEERAKLEQKQGDKSKTDEHNRLQKEWQEQLKARDAAEKTAIKAEEERYKQQEKQRIANAVATSNNLDKINEQQHRKELQRITDAAKQQQDKEKTEAELNKKRLAWVKQVDEEEKRKHQNELDRINKRFDAMRKREENQRRETQAKLNTTQGALGAYNQLYSPQGVRSLNQMKTVLKQLETAQANINRATKEGQRDWNQVGDAIKRVKRDIESTEREMGKLHSQQKGVLDTSGQLARALAAAFSVSAIRGYVNKLMQIRGEFELQQRSLQVLLQNKDEANALWDKTVALAVKSPFTTKQIVTYTKQLAAYRIESEKLYETNKMLADVSAGLGVDMNRLILAFGQVKAANFLRGTELRQFSEAGVNMLDELAKRFTALEGRAVSVGEVFERVSKRMVSFADVEAVFKTITSDGGTFYKMQEKQSETLKGMMLNLKDSYELMLNDIGKESEGRLKGFVSTMRFLVDNWRELAFILEKVVVSYASFKVVNATYVLGMKKASEATLWFNKGLKAKVGSVLSDIQAMTWQEAKIMGVTRAQFAAGKATMYLQGAMRGLWAAFKMAIPFALVGIALELWRVLTKASREAERLRKELNNVVSGDVADLDKAIDRYTNLATRLDKVNKGSDAHREIISKLNSEYGEYLNFVVTEETTMQNLADAYEDVVKVMKEKQALASFEKGMNAISQSYGNALTEAKEDFYDLFEGASIKSKTDKFKFLVPTEKEIDDIYAIIQQRTKELDADKFDSLKEQSDLIQEVVSGYYGDEFSLSRNFSQSIELLDILVKRKKQEKELQEEINAQYKEVLHSREAQLELDKLLNEYDEKRRKIEGELSGYEKEKALAKLADEQELAVIDLKFRFNLVEEPEATKQKDAIINWAKGTIADINKAIYEGIAGVDTNQLDSLNDKIKQTGEEMESTFKGNVDLLHRQIIPAAKLAEKGWEDVGEGIATVFSSQYGVKDKKGNIREILVTPILPNGDVLSQEELERYIDEELEGAKDVLNADTKGIVISVDVDETSGEKLHKLQEEYYNALEQRNALFVDFSEEELSKVLFTRHIKDSKTINDYLKDITNNWKQQNEIIAEQISLKSALGSLDEANENILQTALRKEELYRKIAELLGVELEYTERLSEETRNAINAILPEEYQISLEQAYGGIDKIIADLKKEEAQHLNIIEQINERKKEGLPFNEQELKDAEDAYWWTKKRLDLIDPKTKTPIVESKVNTINAKLEEKYQIDAVDRTKDEVTLLSEANSEKEKAIAYEKQLNAQKEQGHNITKEELDAAKKDVEQYTLLWKLLGGTEKETTGGKGRSNSLYDERIKVIDDLNKKYRELNKTLDKSTSLQGAFDAYIDAFADAYEGISWIPKNVRKMSAEEFVEKVLNFPNEDALVNFLDRLAKEPMKTFEKIKVELAKGEYVMDMQVEMQQKNDKAFQDQIEQMFSGYELSLELEKLNIPRDVAERLFGVDTFDLSEIRQKLEDELYNLQIAGGGQDQINALQKYLNRVVDMERKAQEERLKKYVAFARGAISERAKIKLEELNKLAEIEKTFEHKGTDTEAQRAEKDKYKKLATEQARKEANDALQKLEWEAFRSSDTFNMIFDDLENAGEKSLQVVIDKLKAFKEQWKDMPFDQMRQVVDLLQKAEEAQKSSDNPFVEAKRLRNSIKKDGRSYEKATQDLIGYDNMFRITKEDISNYQLFEQIQSGLADSTQLTTEQQAEYARWIKLSDDEQKLLLRSKEYELEISQQNAANTRKHINNIKKLPNEYQKQADAIGKMQDMANDLYNSFKGLHEALGGDTDSIDYIFADMGMQVANTVLQTMALQVQLASATVQAGTFAAAMNAALGPIGLVVAGMSVLTSVFSAFSQAHDKKKERQIQAEIKLVERLNKLYDQLGKQIEKAYSIDTLEAANKNAKANLEEQIRATERMIDAERDKKKTDWERIKEFNEQIQENLERLKELEQQRLQELGGIGGEDYYKDNAQTFVDAWLDGFLEIGDGLTNLEDEFDTLIMNIAKKQLMLKATDKFLAPLYMAIDEAVRDTDVTRQEMEDIEQKAKDALPQLNTFLKGLMEQMGMGDLAGSKSELGTLGAGIQGVSEETANILASYMNSIRFYVADSNTQLKALVAAQGVNADTPNPMLSQLLVIAEQTRSIRDMFESVIGRGGNNKHGGAYLKVDIG